jgi:uncharacterized protein YjbI with pentapeptide repeats
LSPEATPVSDTVVAQQLCWLINGELPDEGVSTSEYPGSDSIDALSPETRKQFIGAKFGDLCPPEMELVTVEEFRGIDETSPIDLRESTVQGEMDWSNRLIRHEVNLSGGHFAKVDFRGARFEGPVRFIEATIDEDLRFDGTTVEESVWLNEATILGDIQFDDSTLRGVRLRAIELEGDARFKRADLRSIGGKEAHIGGELRVNKATTSGDIRFDAAVIEDTTWLSDATIGSDVKFEGAELNDQLRAKSATVAGNVRFGTTTVEGNVIFTDSTVEEDVQFDHTSVKGDAQFQRATVEGNAEFRETQITGTARFTEASFACLEAEPILTHPQWSVLDLKESVIESGTLEQPVSNTVFYDLKESTIGDVKIRSNDSNPYQYARFLHTRFDGFDFATEEVYLNATGWKLYDLPTVGYEHIGLLNEYPASKDMAITTVKALANNPEVTREVASKQIVSQELPSLVANIPDGLPIEAEGVAEAIKTISTEIAELDTSTDAYFDPREDLDVKIKPAESVRNPVIVDDAISMAPLIDAISQTSLDTYRSSPSEKAATQRLGKNAAREAGLSNVAANFFIWEMRARRQRHAAEAFAALGENSFRARLQAAKDWVTNGLLDLVTVYGERTYRVIIVSLAIIVAFGGIYSFLGVPAPTGSSSSDYLLFSFQSFTSFILGNAPQTQNFWIQFTSAVEGFTGAFFVALFVFALTRSVQR